MIPFDRDFTMTLDGRPVTAASSLEVINPATEEIVGWAPDISKAQLDEAVAAARRAFPIWSAAPIDERRAALRKMAAALAAHADEFTRLFTLEQGRPLQKAKNEILGAVYWLTEVAKQDIPISVNEDTPERRSETRHVPIGVVAGIVPWNFPLMLGIWKIGPALLTGNTIIVKPSPFTPLTMLKLGELMRDQLPPGVFSVISGGDQVGPWLTEHPGVDKVSFTGSSATGRRVMASAAATLKRLTLELGGNDAAIVMPDVDPKAIAEKLFWSAFNNSAQLCIATKRMYIHKDIYDAVAAALVAYARQVKMGDGMEQGNELGPIQNRAQFIRVKDLIADAKAQGLKFLLGGDVPEGKGFFVPVSIVDNPPDDSRVVTEEAFGPVLPLLKFGDAEEAVRRANDTDMGLAGSVWTADVERGAEIAARLQTGTVWVNEAQYIAPWTPFAGHKQSGLGAEQGLDGLLEYTNLQTITVRKALPS